MKNSLKTQKGLTSTQVEALKNAKGTLTGAIGCGTTHNGYLAVTEKPAMQVNMESCIEYARTWKVKELWMQDALREDIGEMVETMNMWLCNPSPFYQGKFIKLYKRAKNLKQS